MPYISQDTIQELNSRLDPISLVSEYVQVEKRSGRFWACCPFHQEKTPSFTVNPEAKSYYCFGCQKGGSILNFVMEMDKLTFPEAVETLAKKYGIEVKYEQGEGRGFSAQDEAVKKTREELFELYHRISGTFHHFLLKNPEAKPVLDYIRSRGISAEMIERFRLGYSPADRSWLYNFLSQKGYSSDFLAKSGLFSSRNQRSPLFAGRLMFPISDRQGRTLAFGGRYLGEILPNQAYRDGREAPKYINSPELAIYKKGETLYALDLALPEIRRTKIAYLAEGYTDVMALHQAGISNALAPLGTAFTDDQAKLLKRWADLLVLFLDSDGAGEAAVLKTIMICRKHGLSSAVVVAERAGPGGDGIKDPADILQKSGPEALQNIAKYYINDFDYLLRRVSSLYESPGSGGTRSRGLESERKAQAAVFLFPYMELLESEVSRDSCIEAAADALGMLPSAVAEDFQRFRQGIKSEPKVRRQVQMPIQVNDELRLLVVIALDFINPGGEKLFSKFRTIIAIEEIEDPNAKEIYIALEECLRYGETALEELLSHLASSDLRQFVIEKSATGEFSLHSSQQVTDGTNKIRMKLLERRQEELIIEFRSLKQNSSDEFRNTKEQELLVEKMQLDTELIKIKQGR